jgi:hypothetical protein
MSQENLHENMMQKSSKAFRSLCFVLLPLIAVSVSGCAGDDSALKQASTYAGFATNVSPKAPDFITASRKQNTDFVSVANTNPPRALRPKTPAEIEQAKAALDQIRSTNEGLGAEAKTLAATPLPEAPVLLRP